MFMPHLLYILRNQYSTIQKHSRCFKYFAYTNGFTKIISHGERLWIKFKCTLPSKTNHTFAYALPIDTFTYTAMTVI